MDQWACCKMSKRTTFNAIPLTFLREMIPSQEEIKRITLGCATGTKHAMFSLAQEVLHNHGGCNCKAFWLLSHYFWGSTVNFLESAEPGNREGDRLLTIVLSDALSKTPVSVKTLWHCETLELSRTVLHCRPALMKCVYIIRPFVSTSYLVAVQASPQAWPHSHLYACQQVI